MEVELGGPAGQVEGVDRNAVAAQAGAGGEAHEPVGLGGGRVDHLPHVQVHAVAEHRQLVDECDVDAAKDVLKQLHQLGGVGGGDRDEGVHADRVQRDCALGAGRCQAAHHLGGGAHGVVGAAGVDPLGRHGQVEVLPGAQ